VSQSHSFIEYLLAVAASATFLILQKFPSLRRLHYLVRDGNRNARIFDSSSLDPDAHCAGVGDKCLENVCSFSSLRIHHPHINVPSLVFPPAMDRHHILPGLQRGGCLGADFEFLPLLPRPRRPRCRGAQALVGRPRRSRRVVIATRVFTTISVISTKCSLSLPVGRDHSSDKDVNDWYRDSCHVERTRERSGFELRSQILREYAQDDGV
jgi:hypothetical protein